MLDVRYAVVWKALWIPEFVARNDAESTEDGRLPPSAHIVHLKGDCKTRGEFIGSKMFNGCTVGIWENVDVGRR